MYCFDAWASTPGKLESSHLKNCQDYQEAYNNEGVHHVLDKMMSTKMEVVTETAKVIAELGSLLQVNPNGNTLRK